MNARRTPMKRFVFMAVIAATLLSTGHAQAAIFEPQHDWWSSGRTCVDSRNPPGLAWDDPAPRACVPRPGAVLGAALGKPRADGLGKDDRVWLASAEAARTEKLARK